MNALQAKFQGLHQYSAPLTAADDLFTFWEQTKQEAKLNPLSASKTLVEDSLLHAITYKVTYCGFDDTPIQGWFLIPVYPVQKQYPCVLSFHGYTGQKGLPEEYAQWLLMGVAVFAIDIRGQGGETGNHLKQTFGTTKGWITQGILDKDTCYYKAITVDCLRALDWLVEQPEIDAERIGIVGGSQGGGLALICTALSDKVAATIAHIPNMCHMDFGVINSTSSLTEIGPLLLQYPAYTEQVFDTLSYFDMLNLAHLIRTPLLVSVGLKDTVCLPETIFAVYNRIAPEHKSILIDPFAGHEVSRANNREGLRFMQDHLM
ncbi:acetylesterase [Paenibacillus psychroresistens]|uniref:Acetylesterase n=1 Tax=Paenibacillus psychroresistens TaxID=1778678 RepID=A0A6B8RJF7_9BACL|nr:acetylxylan esterase [Paenibacillus psychroresistens]QGQ95526.1 acetylesterase [Paenibacillus psychroresistens]